MHTCGVAHLGHTSEFHVHLLERRSLSVCSISAVSLCHLTFVQVSSWNRPKALKHLISSLVQIVHETSKSSPAYILEYIGSNANLMGKSFQRIPKRCKKTEADN